MVKKMKQGNGKTLHIMYNPFKGTGHFYDSSSNGNALS